MLYRFIYRYVYEFLLCAMDKASLCFTRRSTTKWPGTHRRLNSQIPKKNSERCFQRLHVAICCYTLLSWFQIGPASCGTLSLGDLKQRNALVTDCEIPQFPCRWKQKSQQLRRQKTDDLTRLWRAAKILWRMTSNNIKHHQTTGMLHGAAVSQLCGSILVCNF